MPSANDFTDQALRLLGVIDPTENASPEDAETGFDVLNDWIDALGLERQTIYTVLRTPHTLVSGTASYTIGSGGTINIARPIWIDHAGLILDTGASEPVEARIRVLTDDEYQHWPQKTFQSTFATGVYYDHNWSSGLGRVYPLPIPDVGTTQVVLYTPTALTEFADQSTNYTFPPGYRRAIRLNLALELSAHYPGAAPPQNLPQLAMQSLANIKRGNTRLSHVEIDPGLSGRRGMTESRFLGGTF